MPPQSAVGATKGTYNADNSKSKSPAILDLCQRARTLSANIDEDEIGTPAHQAEPDLRGLGLRHHGHHHVKRTGDGIDPMPGNVCSLYANSERRVGASRDHHKLRV